MAKQIKQWLMVSDEVYRTNENTNRFIEFNEMLLYWNVRHYNAHLSMNTIKKSGKLMNIVTLEVTDGEEEFKEFCDMAEKVNGLYCVSDIIDNAIRVLDAKSNQE